MTKISDKRARAVAGHGRLYQEGDPLPPTSPTCRMDRVDTAAGQLRWSAREFRNADGVVVVTKIGEYTLNGCRITDADGERLLHAVG